MLSLFEAVAWRKDSSSGGRGGGEGTLPSKSKIRITLTIHEFFLFLLWPFQMLLLLPPSKKRTWKLLVAGSRLHTHSLPLLPVCLFSFFLSAGKLKRKLVGALGSLSSCLYIVFPGGPPPRSPPFPSVAVVQNETCWVLSERLPSPSPACNVRGKTSLWGLGGGYSPVQSSPQSPSSRPPPVRAPSLLPVLWSHCNHVGTEMRSAEGKDFLGGWDRRAGNNSLSALVLGIASSSLRVVVARVGHP